VSGYFVYDPDPVLDWPEGDRVRVALIGPFATREAAEKYANVSHPDDSSGNTVVLQAEKP
jgi:hypothetical protein